MEAPCAALRLVPSRPVRVVVLSAALLSMAGAAFAATPPPIPSLELHNQLIAAEREAATGGEDAGTTRWMLLPRAVHDEYDVVHYDVSLGLDIPHHVLTGTTGVQAQSAIPGLTQVNLDLYACMLVDGVTVNGSPASYSHIGSLLTVQLGGAYEPGQPFTISCTYHGTPTFPGQPLPFRWYSQSGIPMVLSYSEPYGAPAWWVCKDDPKDKATFGIHITCPDTLFAVSNGALDRVVDNGDGTKTYDWTHNYPMSPYLFSIAVTQYAHWSAIYTALDGSRTMDVHYWAYQSDSVDAGVDWSRNVEMMEFYAGLFGEYPFLEEKYAIAEFTHPGAMEHQTATSMGTPWITGDHQNDFVVAHELSHSWVGDMITMRQWSHAWCKEGFASYCEPLYFGDLYGEAYYHDYMDGFNPLYYGQFQIYNMNPPLHGAVYYKGAWVLHMLRHVIGDEAFFEAIYAYTNDPRFRYNVADTEDLRGVFEDVSGRDLVWFFDEWVYHPGYPSYQYDWSVVGSRQDRSHDVELSIAQVQDLGPIFKMPIDVVIETDLGPESFVVWDSLATQSFTLEVTGQPLAVALDPEMWIIRELENLSDVDSDGDGSPRGRPGLPAIVLGSNQPNPFRQTTAIGFSLENAGRVVLEICDVNGRTITRLLDGLRPAGASRIAWDGTDARGRPVSPGVYYCRLRAGADERVRGMLSIR